MGEASLLEDQAVSNLVTALDGERVLFVLGGPADEKGPVFLALQQLNRPVPVNVRHQPGLLLAVGHLSAGLDQQPAYNDISMSMTKTYPAKLTC